MERSRRVFAVAVVWVVLLASGIASSAESRTYKQRITIPVPPASDFAGSGGGDGWDVALTPDAAYNVFHHNYELQVACHRQVDASECWEDGPKTIRDAEGNDFETSQHPAVHLDQAMGRLYVFATRFFDQTAGVVCIDTTQPATNPNPFCGFTALSTAGEAYGQSLGNGVVLGSRFYAFNYVPDNAINDGTRNRLLCLELTAVAPCASQPFAVSAGGVTMTGYFPHPAAAIGPRLVFAVNVDFEGKLVCFDTTTNTNCAGSWPVAEPTGGYFGAPFPLLDPSGAVTGVCLPTYDAPCYSLSGAPVAPPTGLAETIGESSPYNGPAVTIGARVYVPNGNVDQVMCYDYASSAGCPNFPHPLPGLGYMYTVNADPQRPACLWVNADGGEAQIQNFEAYSGGGCGEGPIRVLASSFIPPVVECTPLSWTTLQVLDPPRSAYTDGNVAFRDGSGNAIAGASPRSLDGTGTADLTGLDLEQNGLPQFLITLNGLSGPPQEVTVEVTWTGPAVAGCGPDLIVTRTDANPSIAEVLPGADVYLTLSATLTNEVTGDPLPDREISFSVGGTEVCAALTGSGGVAGCGGVVEVVGSVLSLGYTASYAGDDDAFSSSDDGPLAVVYGTDIPG